MRLGGQEHEAKDLLVHMPASEVLDRWQPGLENAVQVCVVGAGPAGLALASELGKRGIRVSRRVAFGWGVECGLGTGPGRNERRGKLRSPQCVCAHIFKGQVGVVSPDRPFTNTYGVWADEFRSLGFAHTIEHVWNDAVCFFGDRPEEKIHVGRAYAKVGRVAFRQELLKRSERGWRAQGVLRAARRSVDVMIVLVS